MSDIIKTPLQLAVDALQDIANPIGRMRAQAQARGRQFDERLAVHLSRDPAYLQGIASDALALLKIRE